MKKIVVTDDIEFAKTFVPPAGSAFVTLSPGLASFDVADLNKRLAAGENRIIEEHLLAAIAQVVETFLKQNDHPTANAVVPSQDIGEGILRVIVQPGPTTAVVAQEIQSKPWKIRKINMPETKWFSDSLLREKLRIEQGGTIKYGDLDQAISWTNNNPFRRVRVQLDPVPNTTSEADLTIAVEEALPLRISGSYSNSGNDAIGTNQYVAAISYGNLWGLDHQISYQYITTDKPRFFQAHGFDYRVPLPWRHYVQVSASYLRAKPEFYEGQLVQDGETINANLRYTIPLRTGDNPMEVYATTDFKESNNNLAFGGTQVLGTKTDIFQATLGASAIFRDKAGGWLFGATITGSPGRINSRNTDEAFDTGSFVSGASSARAGAKARYAFATISGQRLLNLGYGCDYSVRALFQGASNNLLPSEMLTVGGGATVRGFPEAVVSGDNGFVMNNELLGPSWKKEIKRISKARGPLETRPLLFLDMAKVGAHQVASLDPDRKALAGAGVGVRMSLGTTFSLSADYGWQITSLPYKTDEHSRGHVRATLAF